MKRSILILSLGPVQDFIQSARRCQDLWFGSWLLSEVSRRVARAVSGLCEGEPLIFPGSLKEDSSVANKIVALVRSEDVGRIAQAAWDTLQIALDGQANAVYERIGRHSGPGGEPLLRYLHKDVMGAQIRELMELPWVAVPVAGDDDDAYRAARQRAEQLLAARKSTRSWGSVPWGANVPKSSLDGQRESVIDESLYDDVERGRLSWETARRAFGVLPQERLSGVDLVKRLGEEEHIAPLPAHRRPVFHSTSHMAAAPLFDHFARDDVRGAFDAYIDAIREAAGEGAVRDHRLRGGQGLVGARDEAVYDGSLLYEGRLRDLLDEALVDRAQQVAVVQQLQSLLKAIGHRTPSPYYALLQADGDRMGKLIDGQPSLARHRALSEALDGFATSVRGIVSSLGGSLIYSGGDDVLALLPLHNAIDCARKLRESFAEAMAPFANEGGTAASLSVGIAAVHHLMDFGRAREVAKRAEREAKRTRNALAVIIDKRSGGERCISGSWNEQSGLQALDARLDGWRALFAGGQLSHGLIQDVARLRQLARGDGKGAPPDKLDEMLRFELERVLAQKQPGAQSSAQLDAPTKATLRQFIRSGRWATVDEGLGALSDELYLALELERVAALTSGAAPPAAGAEEAEGGEA